MHNIEENSAVQQFLDQVCGHIRAKKMHPEIREELKSHLEDRVEGLQLQGISPENSVRTAIEEMGSPFDIGKRLNETHKPLLNWRIVLLLAIICAIGIIAAVSVDVSGSTMISDLTVRKSFLMSISLVFLVCFYFFDYQKLRKYSNNIFFMLLFMNVIVLSDSSMTNGEKDWFLHLGPIIINMLYISPILLLLALAGMKPVKDLGWIGNIFQILYRAIIPLAIFTYIGNSVHAGVIYMAGYTMIMWLTKRSIRQFAVFILIPATIFICFIVPHFSTLQHKLIADSAYFQIHMMDAMKSAGWFGHGFASANPNLTYIQSDSLFAYLVYCFGWSFGLILILLVGMFLAQIGKLLVQVKESYGRLLIFVVLFYFSIRFLWPILMTIGVVPYVSMELPFIGYGGYNQWIDLSAMGVVLSVYRQKNMIPSVL